MNKKVSKEATWLLLRKMKLPFALSPERQQGLWGV
jgi:hypothetical protein